MLPPSLQTYRVFFSSECQRIDSFTIIFKSKIVKFSETPIFARNYPTCLLLCLRGLSPRDQFKLIPSLPEITCDHSLR